MAQVAGSVIDFGVDPVLLCHEERLSLLERIEVERARLDALQARTLAAVEADDTTDKQWAREEVACVLKVAPVTALSYLNEASYLVCSLPETVAMLSTGSLTWRHARQLAESTLGLDAATVAAVQSRCLTRVQGRTASEFRQVVRRAVAALDPRRLEEQHALALERRRVAFTPRDDGTTELWALLPADAAARLKSTLDRQARRQRHRRLTDGSRDTRTADQRRADALTDLATTSDAAADRAANESATKRSLRQARRAVRRRTDRPSVQVMVAASTLLGLDNLPGELAGHGPIPASMARRIAADPTGTWRRLLTDPAGQLLEISRSYRPPAALARHVTTRDRTCRFPGCRRQATHCELDHVHDWADGGTTCATNLHPLCARHHHLKHEAPEWHVQRLPDGTTHWRTPTGREIDVPPETYDDVPTRWSDAEDWLHSAPDRVIENWALAAA